MNNHQLQHHQAEWAPSNVVPFQKTDKGPEGQMAEPVSSSAAAGLGAYKVLGLGAILCAAIVVSMATPKSRKELFVALLSTASGAVFGGGAAVSYFGIQAWLGDQFGAMGIIFIGIVCGMPAWVLVRAFWHWADLNKNKTILQMWQEFRGIK